MSLSPREASLQVGRGRQALLKATKAHFPQRSKPGNGVSSLPNCFVFTGQWQ